MNLVARLRDRGVPVRLLAFGSRKFSNRQVVRDALSSFVRNFDEHTVVLVHGDARGADRLAESVWLELGFGAGCIRRYPADWSQGRGAGPRRNRQMIDSGIDLALGFFAGWTPGSSDMLKRCTDASVPVCVYHNVNILPSPELTPPIGILRQSRDPR